MLDFPPQLAKKWKNDEEWWKMHGMPAYFQTPESRKGDRRGCRHGFFQTVRPSYRSSSKVAGPTGRHNQTILGASHVGMGQNPIPLVNIKIAGKWMFIPLMVLIGIDPYPCGCGSDDLPWWTWMKRNYKWMTLIHFGTAICPSSGWQSTHTHSHRKIVNICVVSNPGRVPPVSAARKILLQELSLVSFQSSASATQHG